MSFLRRAIESRSPASIENPAVPLTSSKLLEYLGLDVGTDAGVSVTPENAMKFSAVYRAVALISGSIGSLPIHTYKQGTRNRTTHDVIEDPHPDSTTMEVWETGGANLLLWGNAYFQKIREGGDKIVELWPIPSKYVTPGKTKGTKNNPTGKVFKIQNDTGGSDPYTPNEILHIPGLGYDGVSGLSVIGLARQAIGLGMAAENFGAKFFGKGLVASGYLTTENPKLGEDDAKFLQDQWEKRLLGGENAHRIPVLKNAKFERITIPPNDAQFLETRKFQVTDIARWFGVAPHMLMDVERSTSWGTGIEQQNLGFVIWTLRPWLTRIEKRVKKEILPRDEYAEFVVDALLRGDIKTRYEAYRKGREAGFLVTNDMRRWENLELVEGGDDDYWIPKNMTVKGEEVPSVQED